jgi:succinate dehydrogenase / fumarate reductase, cytochrome b subunit
MSKFPSSTGRGAYIRTRIASFLAVAPLSVWTILHIWNNLAVFQGAEAWQSAVTSYGHPGGMLITSFIVLVPLIIHTLWGIGRVLSARPNNQRYGFYANLKYLLQRLSAVGALLFLGAHLWLAFLEPRLVEGHAETFADISHEMRHHGPTLIVYILGTLGIAYHLANGLYGVAMGWGLTTTRTALRRMEWISITLFAILLAMSWGAIYGLFRAGS